MRGHKPFLTHTFAQSVVETGTIHDVSNVYACLHIVAAYAAANLRDAF